MDTITSRLKKRISSLDAFPKIETQLQKTTETGGMVTIVMFVFLVVLLSIEVYNWRTIHQKFEFIVDETRTTDRQFQINVDITVAMDCAYLRADVLDVTSTSLVVKSELHAQPVVFHSEGTITFTEGFANEDVDEESILDVHRILRRKNKERSKYRNMKGEPNACRFSGSFTVNKVEGMLHFTATGHGYFGAHTPHDAMNFTHRIDELSFGRRYPGLVNPLDHNLEMGKSHFDNFKYFLGVVPTIYVDKARTFFTDVVLTNQYAVTEYSHSVSEENPDALPGVYFTYVVEPVSVRITEYRLGIVQFTTRICGIVGGSYTIIGAILSFFQFLKSPR